MSTKLAFSERHHPHAYYSRRSFVIMSMFSLVTVLTVLNGPYYLFNRSFGASLTSGSQRVPLNAQQVLDRCAQLGATPGPSDNFATRGESDRYEVGTNPTLIRNATIFTGEKNGTVVVHGDLLLDKGIIKMIGDLTAFPKADDRNLTVVDAEGAWVTPGLGIDLHSHLGLLSVPFMAGALDVGSNHGPILPWLRSIDAFNTHDEAFELAIAGGVTSAQVLPGSGNAIGGQAFMMKLRKTSERSPSSMILEPPHTLNGTDVDSTLPLRWRHMKQACGENLRRYGNRMDAMWSLRSAYNEARKIKAKQDVYCRKAEAGLWESLDADYPEDFKWEMLVDVLRGRVKISNHCYEAVDLDDIVRITNEFKFPIASFHHASEAWLVPEVLKKTWGGVPSIAIFATNHRYKRESYRGSEFAPRVLSDHGIPVVMKSDHPVINSRDLIHEAQQAHYFGLPPHLALASVTSVPATAAGLDHRIGILQKGADADVVLWDSHPLKLGATPKKIWIDGILQIPRPKKSNGENEPEVDVGRGKQGEEWREVPDVPNWDKERQRAVDWEGLPPLEGKRTTGSVVFQNVREILTMQNGELLSTWNSEEDELMTAVVKNGQIVCSGGATACLGKRDTAVLVDLHGGSISPGLMSFGSPLGLEEIAGEPSTGDGELYEPFARDIPGILGDTAGVVRAVDALQFGTRNALTAYRSGVTLATSSLAKTSLFGGSSNVISGLSTTFRTGSAHALESGSIVQPITALHVAVGRPYPFAPTSTLSVSTEIAGLRRLLYGWEKKDTETGYWFKQAAEGVVPLVIEVGSADIMATLLILKSEVESKLGTRMRMVFSGAAEAHLLAEDIGRAGVGVILKPVRPFPATWDERRILAGPPISNDTTLVKLLEHGVTVGIGIREAWEARNARFDLSWAALDSNGRITELQAYALGSANLIKLLGVRGVEDEFADLVAYDGGNAFDFSKVVAVVSPQRGLVDIF